MIKLAIFDLDGTLVDSIKDIVDSANEVIETYNRKPIPHEEIKAYIGDGLSAFVRGLAGELYKNEMFLKKITSEFATVYRRRLLKNTKFYPGAENFLNSFKLMHNRKIGVVTNKSELEAKIILRHLGYQDDFFVEIYGGDTFEVKKPHPKPLLEMMKRANVSSKETVMIGDSRQDLEAAHAAETHFLAVSFGYNTEEKLRGHGAKNFLHDFSQLQSKIDTLV